MRRFKHIFFLLVFLGGNIPVIQAQLGVQVGVVLSLGSHVNNIGYTSKIYWIKDFVQVNLSTTTKFNWLSYGSRKKFIEYRLGLGALLLAGKKNIVADFHIDPLNHQTQYQYAIGYNYLWYFDELKTSQRSGGWSLHHNYFSLYFENDVFGGQAKDRFRSGVVQLNYRNGDQKYFMSWYIWTGETANSTWDKTPRAGCPNGYRSLAHLPYGKTSHGIWSVGVHQNLGTRQLATVKLGFDSEQVRHVLQNRLTHDLILLPKRMKRNTPHYPRLNKEGLPVFEKKEMRKNKIYFQVNMNEDWSN